MFVTDLLSLEVSPEHLDLIILPDGHGPDAVFLSELLGERGAHQAAAQVRRRGKVALALFAAGAGHVLVQLHGGSIDGCKDKRPNSVLRFNMMGEKWPAKRPKDSRYKLSGGANVNFTFSTINNYEYFIKFIT